MINPGIRSLSLLMSSPNSVGNGVPHRVRHIDNRGAGLDCCDQSPGTGSRSRFRDASSGRIFQHLHSNCFAYRTAWTAISRGSFPVATQFLLQYEYPKTPRTRESRVAFRTGARLPRQYRYPLSRPLPARPITGPLTTSERLDGVKIFRRRAWKTSFDDIDPQSGQLFGNLDFLPLVQLGP